MILVNPPAGIPTPKHSGPYVTTDPDWKREWIHARPLRYYLHKETEGEQAGKWVVIDRHWDLRATKFYTRKKDCVKAFVKAYAERWD